MAGLGVVLGLFVLCAEAGEGRRVPRGPAEPAAPEGLVVGNARLALVLGDLNTLDPWTDHQDRLNALPPPYRVRHRRFPVARRPPRGCEGPRSLRRRKD